MTTSKGKGLEKNILQMIVAARRLTCPSGNVNSFAVYLSVSHRMIVIWPMRSTRKKEPGTKSGTIGRPPLYVIRCVEGKLYLLHQTVREFLVATSPDTRNESLEAQDTPRHWRTITHSDVWEALHRLDGRQFGSRKSMHLLSRFKLMRKRIRSLLEYSAIYWPAHCNPVNSTTCQRAVAEKTTTSLSRI